EVGVHDDHGVSPGGRVEPRGDRDLMPEVPCQRDHRDPFVCRAQLEEQVDGAVPAAVVDVHELEVEVRPLVRCRHQGAVEGLDAGGLVVHRQHVGAEAAGGGVHRSLHGRSGVRVWRCRCGEHTAPDLCEPCERPVDSLLDVTFPHLELAMDPHDRAGERRMDEGWLAEAWAAPETRVLVVAGSRVKPVDDTVPWVPTAQVPVEGTRVLLGQRDGRVWFAYVVDASYAEGDGWVGIRDL